MKLSFLKILFTILWITESFGAVVPENVKEGSMKSLEAVSQLENLKSNESLASQKETFKSNKSPTSIKEVVSLVDQSNHLGKNPIKKEFNPTVKYKSGFLNNKSELESTPVDIAEYIFWTGDERGVALALKDFIQDGWISKEDAIYFLERVEEELNSLKQRYSADDVPNDDLRKNIEKESPSYSNTYGSTTMIDSPSFRENALGQIIYEIAKKLFTLVGSKSPEIIQQLVKYIETQEADGRLDKDIEKSVMDILVTAFVESVKENDSKTSPLKKLEFTKTLMTKTHKA